MAGTAEPASLVKRLLTTKAGWVKFCNNVFWSSGEDLSKVCKYSLHLMKKASVLTTLKLILQTPALTRALCPTQSSRLTVNSNSLKHVLVNLTNWRQFFMRLSCYWSWISSSHCQSSCGSADYFDNVMTKFFVNNRTDALKTDINWFFTITDCRISRSRRSLTRCTNFKFMCLSEYWP